MLLASFMDRLFFEGREAAEGSKLLAAMKCFLPETSRLGTETLPRSARCVASWLKAAPGLQRLPIPKVILLAIIGSTLRRGALWCAVAFFVQFMTYLRPGVCDALKVKQLIPPQPAAGPQYQLWGLLLNPTEDGVPGKTGLWDQTVLWDNHLWMNEVFARLVGGRHGDSPLWPVQAGAVTSEFMLSCEELSLHSIRPCRYGLRHGGASEDILTKARELEAVKRRGHWKSDSSLKRYGKETRLLAEIQKVSPTVIAYGRLIGSMLPDLFLGRSGAPAPPSRGA